MERTIYKNITIREFNGILASTDEVNKTILSNLYKQVADFITLSGQPNFNGTLIDLLKEYETNAYVVNGRQLTDKEIIDLELTKIRKEYKSQLQQSGNNSPTTTANLSDDTSMGIQSQLLVLVEYYLSQLKIFEEIPSTAITPENIKFIKKRIAYMDAILKIKSGLYYEAYLVFEEELERVINLESNKKQGQNNDYENHNKYTKKR